MNFFVLKIEKNADGEHDSASLEQRQMSLIRPAYR
jgi:hypothetical protein